MKDWYIDYIEDKFVIKDNEGNLVVEKLFNSEEEAQEYMIELEWEEHWGDLI